MEKNNNNNSKNCMHFDRLFKNIQNDRIVSEPSSSPTHTVQYYRKRTEV